MAQLGRMTNLVLRGIVMLFAAILAVQIIAAIGHGVLPSSWGTPTSQPQITFGP
jgi:hypothetical protein